MNNYHAHIYFDPANDNIAKNIYSEVMSIRSGFFSFCKLYPKKVGPHFLPMIELHFSEAHKAEAIEWINSHRKNLSVLIHVDTGDDIQDHLAPIWLGKELPIDFTFFSKIQQDPTLRIHSR